MGLASVEFAFHSASSASSEAVEGPWDEANSATSKHADTGLWSEEVTPSHESYDRQERESCIPANEL
eukprot:jgi/Phyca11/507832/fgenesh2_kg.PHYCAscaffold_30_\